MRLCAIALVLLISSALPAAADPITDNLTPPVDEDIDGDHVVGEEMCARPAAGD